MMEVSVWTYRMTHGGDPCIIKKHLELGHQNCMKKIRPYAKEGDWIIAIIGKTFYEVKRGKRTHLFNKGRYNFDKSAHVAYAMRVSRIYKVRGKSILSSKKGQFFCFFENPIKIPKKFYGRITRGQAPKKNTFSETKNFIRWVKSQKTTQNRLHLKSAGCT